MHVLPRQDTEYYKKEQLGDDEGGRNEHKQAEEPDDSGGTTSVTKLNPAQKQSSLANLANTDTVKKMINKIEAEK